MGQEREALEWVELGFRGTIRIEVTPEVEQGDLTQAVQNEIGHTGAQVITAELVDGVSS